MDQSSAGGCQGPGFQVDGANDAAAADWRKLAQQARGRGAGSNASGRYERVRTEPFDDGWADVDDDLPPIRTQSFVETAKSVITYNKSPDLSFDRTINPYRGCEHGCIYCYARPKHAYSGLSAGLDFETKIFVKDGAAERLKQELGRPRYRPRAIVLGGDTDIYQPLEKDRRVTRSIMEVLSACRHPFGFVTKSALVLRDLDLLAPLAEQGLVRAAISLTTLDPRLARRMEPRAAAPHRRLSTIKALSEAGVPVTVMTAPLIPALNDMELDALLEAAAEAGAVSAGYVLLRLPMEISGMFQDWLATHYPDRAARIMKLIRETRDGKDYQSEFGVRQRGTGPYARLIAQRFNAACTRFGLDRNRPPLRTDLFRPPPPKTGAEQLNLF
ncbi:MAG: PA0069 family radical SAM protein [Pseudomonadota bacterium]